MIRALSEVLGGSNGSGGPNMQLARLLPRTALAVIAMATAAIAMPTELQRSAPERAPPTAETIVGRGRIEARDGLILLAGPVGGGTISRLAIAVGDRLASGDVVAELQDRTLRAAAVAAAERDLDVARAELARVAAPAKQSEIDMEQARLALEGVLLQEAQADAARAEQLFRRGQLAAASHERAVRALARARSALLHAQARLAAITEVRAVDVAAALATVAFKEARLAEARAALEQSFVRSPCTCSVIDVFARMGEAIGPRGIVRLADLDSLVVTAEIDERQVLGIREGQPVQITSRAFGETITGRVTRIGTISSINDESAPDLMRSVDARVAEVEVTADPPSALPRLLGLDLEVAIQTTATVAQR
jgi:ABC exporter DevB family membrane fusion protein